MKTLSKITAVVGLTLGLFGCSEQMGVFENLPVKYNKGFLFLFDETIKIYSIENKGYIEFIDGTLGEPRDGRVDGISLYNVKKDDPLEKYATFEIGQKLLNQFLDKK